MNTIEDIAMNLRVRAEHEIKLAALARPIESEADAAAKLEIVLRQLLAAAHGDLYGDEPEMLRLVADGLDTFWRQQKAA